MQGSTQGPRVPHGPHIGGKPRPYYDQTKVEQLRATYATVNFFPQTGPSEQVQKRDILDFARLQGASDEQIKRMQEVLARAKNIDEAVEEIRKFRDPEFETNGNGYQAKTIGEEDLIAHVEMGWESLKELSGNRYLIRRVS